MWNGWATQRRFQGRGRCVLGCGDAHAEDSVEHYAHCQIVLEVGQRYLNTPPLQGAARTGGFIVLGLQAGQVGDDLLAKRAVLVYAAYRTMHTLRGRRRLPTQEQAQLAKDMLKQMAREAARRHPGTAQRMNAAWLRPGGAGRPGRQPQPPLEAAIDLIDGGIALG